MKKVLILLVCASLSSCTSIIKEVNQKVQIGETKEVLFKKMGEPDYIGRRTAELTGYAYARRGEVCEVVVKENLVAEINCGMVNSPQPVYYPMPQIPKNN